MLRCVNGRLFAAAAALPTLVEIAVDTPRKQSTVVEVPAGHRQVVENEEALLSSAQLHGDLAFAAKACDALGNTPPMVFVNVVNEGFQAIATTAQPCADFARISANFAWPERDRVVFCESLNVENDFAGGGARVAIQLCGIGEARVQEVPLILLGGAFTKQHALPLGVLWDQLCMRVLTSVSLTSAVTPPCQRVRVYAHVWGDATANSQLLLVKTCNECISTLKQALGLRSVAEQARDQRVAIHVPSLVASMQEILFSPHTIPQNKRRAMELLNLDPNGPAPSAAELRSAITQTLTLHFF